MFDNPQNRTFLSAPQSVTALIAALLEPSITVLTFIVATLSMGESMDRPAMTLCLLVLALTFPGSNRFRDNVLGAAVDIVASWVSLLAILALCAYATQSFRYFENDVLLTWVIATPILQWIATAIGRLVIVSQARHALARRTVVVVGAGALGVKVARALQDAVEPSNLLGYFDDRLDHRIDAEAKSHVLGNLSEVGAYVLAHGVREVYITLPLGSQPRIVELLDRLQGTTASLFFVPDVFGISIIQAASRTSTAFRSSASARRRSHGTNLLVKRLSDVVLAALITVLISPVLLAIAIGVKLSSPGPVIFRQRRNGLDGDEIVVYKFGR